MCPDQLQLCIEDRIKSGKKPKAIIVVHLYGMPAKMDEICRIAVKYNIPIIEDAAEGLGSKYKGQPLGAIGDFGIFSFNGNKIITTSGGGALISENLEVIQKAKFLSTQARDDAPHYEHSQIGYNYRLSNVSAAIGLGQLKVLNERVAQRRNNYEFYVSQLSHLPNVRFLEEPTDFFSNRWITTILFKDIVVREKIRLELEKKNIESRPLWKPMHMQPVFKQCQMYGGAVCEALFQKGLCLPSGSNLSQEDLVRVVKVIIENV